MAEDLIGNYVQELDRYNEMELNSQFSARKLNKENEQKLIFKIRECIELSSGQMSTFYPRWNANKKKMLPSRLDEDSILVKDSNKNNPQKSKEEETISMPYCFSALRTIMTYVSSVLIGRKPEFGISRIEDTTATRTAENMEKAVAYQADKIRLKEKFLSTIYSAEVFGVGVMKVYWDRQYKQIVKARENPITGKVEKFTEEVLTYAGNQVDVVDVFTWYPDPRVAMKDAPIDAEFIFEKMTISRINFRKIVENGAYDYDWREISKGKEAVDLDSNGWIGLDDETSHEERMGSQNTDKTVKLIEGTIWLEPEEYGLPGSTTKLYLITMLDDRKIIRMTEMKDAYGHHPYVVVEPYTTGFGFGQYSIVDYLAPLQEMCDWLLNSRMTNVRRCVYNMGVYDPTMISGEDLKNSKAGSFIPMKSSSIGKNPNQAISYVQVPDVTQNYMVDLQSLSRMMDNISGVNDNIRGESNPSSRRSATEIRTTTESASSRLAMHTQVYSSQMWIKLGQIMVSNNLQYYDEEFTYRVTGNQEGLIPLNALDIAGDYTFQVTDGLLPIDKLSMADTWKELYKIINSNPALQQKYGYGEKILMHIANLSGANDLDKMISQQPQMASEDSAVAVDDGTMTNAQNAQGLL